MIFFAALIILDVILWGEEGGGKEGGGKEGEEEGEGEGETEEEAGVVLRNKGKEEAMDWVSQARILFIDSNGSCNTKH